MTNELGNKHLNLGVAAISFAVLTMELSMIRIMEVILAANTGYMALTSAMFALGLGGVYQYLFPTASADLSKILGRLALVFAVAAPAVILVFNLLPFGFEIQKENLLAQVLCWSGMYIALILPFFAAGLMLAIVFQTYASSIDRLYFFDLIAAGCACLLFIPLLPAYGPGGLIFVASAASLVAALAFFRYGRLAVAACGGLAVAMVAVPLLVDGYIEFEGHANKRDNDRLIDQGHRVHVQWDPVSKLDVFDIPWQNSLLFSIDGGSQGSWLGKFDGDYSQFTATMEEKPDSYFFGKNSIVHYFKHTQGKQPETLIIGSSAGGEMKAAILFGAEHVDAVELVGAIIEAERNEFADYGSGVYNHPKVNPVVGEGRSFLRASDKRYDIIQMFSNHSTATITQGSNASGIVYLQTVEAYKEYFNHLSADGVLQINHHVWPRMLTTAAQAWNELGRNEFWRHALVIEDRVADTLPTLLVKMSPWTAEQVETVMSYVGRVTFNETHRPQPDKPSARVHGDNVLEATVTAHQPTITGIQVLFGTYGQQGVPYDVHVEILDADQRTLRTAVIEGGDIGNNRLAFTDIPLMHGVEDEELTVRISAPDAVESNSLSVWLARDGAASMNFLPGERIPSSLLAFDPLNPSENLVAKELLQSPFPYDVAESIPWDITPATDFAPFFNMFRKTTARLGPGEDNVLDRNTASLLNTRMEHGYPKDWIHLIVVAVVSVAFSLIFIGLPLLRTNLRDAAWSGMSRDIVYFACLGLGFIMFQVLFIQLFQKLIGFPTHTFVLVISTMLLSAGLGSVYSQRFLKLVNDRPQIVFTIIVAYGLAFVLSFEGLFHFLLGFSLPVRMACGALLIAPLSFFMGMPFPIGILRLGERKQTAISWAWALNGFFTVLGGYLAILIALMSNFIVVLYLATAIYACAALVARSRLPEYRR